MFCEYKNLFGEPNTGLHRYRIFNIAIVDFGLTVMAAFIIAKLFNFGFWITLFVLLLLGIILHHLFCVKTTVDKLIFGE